MIDRTAKLITLIITLTLIFGVIIGYIYNYTLFVINFDIDIFNFIQLYDLIFSWIGNILLISIFLTISFMTLIIYLVHWFNILERLEMENYYLLNIISFIFLVILTSLLFYFLMIYFKNYNINHLYLILIFSALFYLTLVIYKKTDITINERSTLNTTQVLTLIIPVIIASSIYLAYSAGNSSALDIYDYTKKTSLDITLVRGLKLKDHESYHYYLIGATSSHSFFYAVDYFDPTCKKTIIINNQDISRLESI